MKEEEVRPIVESIMKKLFYKESIEEIVEFYKREYMSLPPWLITIGMHDSETQEQTKKDYTIWDEILPSMYTMPEKVHISESICPDCGERYVELFFASPTWTWKALCGRGGHMVICPGCPKMVEFGLTIMN